jgi:PhnB protein
MSQNVKAIPEGYHTVTPFLSLKGAEKAIQFYKKAFGAKEIEKHHGPDGKIMHAAIKIGDSIILLADEFPDSKCGMCSPESLNATTVVLHIYVEDVDALFDQSIKAGSKVIMPVMDTFWGDRYGQLQDPFGHRWSIATHKKDLTTEQVNQAAEEWMKNCDFTKKCSTTS